MTLCCEISQNLDSMFELHVTLLHLVRLYILIACLVLLIRKEFFKFIWSSDKIYSPINLSFYVIWKIYLHIYKRPWTLDAADNENSHYKCRLIMFYVTCVS